MSNATLFNIIGTLGASLILFGFYRISIGKWQGKSFWYELDNLVGALLLIAYQIHNHTYITVVLNVVWATVAIRGLTSFGERRLQFRRRRRDNS